MGMGFRVRWCARGNGQMCIVRRRCILLFVICTQQNTAIARDAKELEKNLFIFYFIPFFDSKIYGQLVRAGSSTVHRATAHSKHRRAMKNEKYDIIIISSFALGGVDAGAGAGECAGTRVWHFMFY